MNLTLEDLRLAGLGEDFISQRPRSPTLTPAQQNVFTQAITGRPAASTAPYAVRDPAFDPPTATSYVLKAPTAGPHPWDFGLPPLPARPWESLLMFGVAGLLAWKLWRAL